MRYLSRCIFLPALLASALGQGATPYEGDLPIELARYFTGGGLWYSDLPDDFPPFTLPASLQVMGSLNQGQRKQVILTTTMERDAAQEALAEAFLAEGGWIRKATPSEEALKPRGFVEQGRLAIPSPASFGIELCHDSYGTVQINSRFAVDVIYMSFASSPRRGGSGCLRQRELEQQLMAPTTNPVMLNVPFIELPAGTVSPGNGGIYNDGPVPENEFATVLRLNAEDQSLKRLNRNFARQMRGQGWKRDKQWSGDLSAGSSWTQQTDDDRELSAFLSIVRVAEAEYEMSLRLLLLE